MSRVFYDTCVFLIAKSTGDGDYRYCYNLTDPAQVKWTIVVSALSHAEASIGELLERLEVQCALQGVGWLIVEEAEVKAFLKEHPALKTALKALGVGASDLRQVAAALAAKCAVLVTRDTDYELPANKANRGMRGDGDVARTLRKDWNLRVLRPSTAWQELHGE